MSYFFQVSHKTSYGTVFITPEYLCEETNKNNLLILSLPSFYKIQNFYKKYYKNFYLYISNNEFLYSLTNDEYSLTKDLNTRVGGKYFLIIYATNH